MLMEMKEKTTHSYGWNMGLLCELKFDILTLSSLWFTMQYRVIMVLDIENLLYDEMLCRIKYEYSQNCVFDKIVMMK